MLSATGRHPPSLPGKLSTGMRKNQHDKRLPGPAFYGTSRPVRGATARRSRTAFRLTGQKAIGSARRCCSSSVVEHSLGKGEVESSILSCSTIPYRFGAA